ncbi:MAG: hypothetical protein IJL75_05180 [Eubacterium sp.]|nr:hypothetical protein [Eubacterium sp.]
MKKETKKLSEILFETAQPEWDKAVAENFVVEMAQGTLDPARFRKYMIQDYIYLVEYIEILELIREQAGKHSGEAHIETLSETDLEKFLDRVISETNSELNRVHIPKMEELGISESEISQVSKIKVISDYIDYMKTLVKNEGLLIGLVALLQCSWGYAYIAQTAENTYRDTIRISAYKSWFDAYSCDDYVKANQDWVDMVDSLAQVEGSARSVEVFKQCAEFETKLWGEL